MLTYYKLWMYGMADNEFIKALLKNSTAVTYTYTGDKIVPIYPSTFHASGTMLIVLPCPLSGRQAENVLSDTAQLIQEKLATAGIPTNIIINWPPRPPGNSGDGLILGMSIDDDAYNGRPFIDIDLYRAGEQDANEAVAAMTKALDIPGTVHHGTNPDFGTVNRDIKNKLDAEPKSCEVPVAFLQVDQNRGRG
jgi:hypothetical protein